MRQSLARAVSVSALIAAAGAANASSITSWNDVLLDGWRSTEGVAPPALARAGAIVQVSVFDAVNSIIGGYTPMYSHHATPGADKDAAVITAAHTSLSALFGAGAGNAAFQAQIDAKRDADLALIPNSGAKTLGMNLGVASAMATINARVGDGSEGTEGYMPGTNPGDWAGDYAGGDPMRGVGYQYRNASTWTMSSHDQFRPAAPHALDSAEYAAEFNEVKELGAANSATRTAEQTQQAWFWGNDRDSTYKPPGQLNDFARTVADSRPDVMGADGTDERTMNEARLLALVNIALADAGICAWDAKYSPEYQHLWRPIEGIRKADTDGNADTISDPTWEPLSHMGVGGADFTPGFPAYVSGHATFAAAQAAILRNFFGTDTIDVLLTTDDADFHALMGGDPNASMHYTSITQAAIDNGLSRLFLGVHWRQDAVLGYAGGTSVGDWVFAQSLQVPTPGVAAVGAIALAILPRRRR